MAGSGARHGQKQQAWSSAGAAFWYGGGEQAVLAAAAAVAACGVCRAPALPGAAQYGNSSCAKPWREQELARAQAVQTPILTSKMPGCASSCLSDLVRSRSSVLSSDAAWTRRGLGERRGCPTAVRSAVNGRRFAVSVSIVSKSVARHADEVFTNPYQKTANSVPARRRFLARRRGDGRMHALQNTAELVADCFRATPAVCLRPHMQHL